MASDPVLVLSNPTQPSSRRLISNPPLQFALRLSFADRSSHPGARRAGPEPPNSGPRQAEPKTRAQREKTAVIDASWPSFPLFSAHFYDVIKEWGLNFLEPVRHAIGDDHDVPGNKPSRLATGDFTAANFVRRDRF